jgi:uncharacterized protein (TIGR03084 family)
MSRVDEVLADLRAEGDQLEALVSGLPDDEHGWRAPTPAAGWDVAHQVAHLAWTDETAVLAAAAATAGGSAPAEATAATAGGAAGASAERGAWHAALLAAAADPGGFVDARAARDAQAPATELLERWHRSRTRLACTLEALPAGTRIPWYGPPMSATSMATARFMETWAHGRDVAAALGVDLPADDRVRHVVHLGVRTRDFSYVNRGLAPPAEEFRVRLTLPGGDLLEVGPEQAAQSVTGPAYDFALLVTQRVHRTDTGLVAEGADAEEWLGLAQAFAGPPGPGRRPR